MWLIAGGLRRRRRVAVLHLALLLSVHYHRVPAPTTLSGAHFHTKDASDNPWSSVEKHDGPESPPDEPYELSTNDTESLNKWAIHFAKHTPTVSIGDGKGPIRGRTIGGADEYQIFAKYNFEVSGDKVFLLLFRQPNMSSPSHRLRLFEDSEISVKTGKNGLSVQVFGSLNAEEARVGFKFRAFSDDDFKEFCASLQTAVGSATRLTSVPRHSCTLISSDGDETCCWPPKLCTKTNSSETTSSVCVPADDERSAWDSFKGEIEENIGNLSSYRLPPKYFHRKAVTTLIGKLQVARIVLDHYLQGYPPEQRKADNQWLQKMNSLLVGIFDPDLADLVQDGYGEEFPNIADATQFLGRIDTYASKKLPAGYSNATEALEETRKFLDSMNPKLSTGSALVLVRQHDFATVDTQSSRGQGSQLHLQQSSTGDLLAFGLAGITFVWFFLMAYAVGIVAYTIMYFVGRLLSRLICKAYWWFKDRSSNHTEGADDNMVANQYGCVQASTRMVKRVAIVVAAGAAFFFGPVAMWAALIGPGGATVSAEVAAVLTSPSIANSLQSFGITANAAGAVPSHIAGIAAAALAATTELIAAKIVFNRLLGFFHKKKRKEFEDNQRKDLEDRLTRECGETHQWIIKYSEQHCKPYYYNEGSDKKVWGFPCNETEGLLTSALSHEHDEAGLMEKSSMRQPLSKCGVQGCGLAP